MSHRLFCFGAAFLGTGFVTRARVAFVLLDVLVAGGVFAAVLARFGIALERHCLYFRLTYLLNVLNFILPRFCACA